MKRIRYFLFAAFIFYGLAYAGTVTTVPKLQDAAGVKIQSHADDGKKEQALTVASTTIDMSNDVSWRVYVPADCKFRTMSTSTKAGLQKTLSTMPGGFGMVVNHRTPFTNFSGCTSGELSRM